MSSRQHLQIAEMPLLVRDLADVACRQLVQAQIDGARAKALGEQIAIAISEEFAGSQFYVPMGSNAQQRARDRQILTSLAAGQSAEVISRALKIPLRTIYRRLRRLRQLGRIPSDQLSLFDLDSK